MYTHLPHLHLHVMTVVLQVHISYLEIYNEAGYDLLEADREVKAMEDLTQVVDAGQTQTHLEMWMDVYMRLVQHNRVGIACCYWWIRLHVHCTLHAGASGRSRGWHSRVPQPCTVQGQQ